MHVSACFKHNLMCRLLVQSLSRSLSAAVLEGVWACKARLIYEVGLGLILLTRLVYDDPHRRAARLYFTVARVSRSVAWKNGAKSNLFGLKATVRSCCLRRGIQGWCQGWDEAPGPAPGDLQGRNMPAKTIFLNLIISHGGRWMQGQSRRYHSQHHHHPTLTNDPCEGWWRVCMCLFTREIKVKLMKRPFFWLAQFTHSSIWRKLHSHLA